MRTAKTDKARMPLDCRKMRDLRESLGLTQAQAAKLAGLGNSARWNDIESGRRTNVTVASLERIAGALGVKARDLLK